MGLSRKVLRLWSRPSHAVAAAREKVVAKSADLPMSLTTMSSQSLFGEFALWACKSSRSGALPFLSFGHGSFGVAMLFLVDQIWSRISGGSSLPGSFTFFGIYLSIYCAVLTNNPGIVFPVTQGKPRPCAP